MPIERAAPRYATVPATVLDAWQKIPTTIASDCMNWSGSMVASIKPVAPGIKVCGQARTVAAMVGDNSCIHAALASIRPGEVLAIDGGGFTDIALWGGIMTKLAIARRIAGVIVDGSVRDIAEIRASGFPCFARGAVPRGPHKGFGGKVDGAASVGGVSISPGDLVLGDDDGVVVVPLNDADKVLSAAKNQLALEADRLNAALVSLAGAS